MKKIQQPLTKEKILDFLRENKSLLQKEFGVTKVGLFGSYAREEQEDGSDVDIGIVTTIHTLDSRYNLKIFFEQNYS